MLQERFVVGATHTRLFLSCLSLIYCGPTSYFTPISTPKSTNFFNTIIIPCQAVYGTTEPTALRHCLIFFVDNHQPSNRNVDQRQKGFATQFHNPSYRVKGEYQDVHS